MICPKIHSATALDHSTLLVCFTNQEKRKYNFNKIMEKPIFAALKNPAFFKNFQVDPSGYGIVWNDEIDISEYEIWIHGIPV